MTTAFDAASSRAQFPALAITDIGNAFVPTSSGRTIPLTQIARIDLAWEPGVLWREGRRKPRPDNKHTGQIEWAKNKNGPCDTVQLWFDGATQRWESISREDGYA